MGTHSDDLLHLLLKVLVQHPGEQGRGGIKRNGLSLLRSKGRKHQTGNILMLSLVLLQAPLFTYFISINKIH